jgi:uncharacterized protein
VTAPQFEALLRLQDLDTALDQHRHRRTVLPEREDVQDSARGLADTNVRLGQAAAARDEVAAREESLEGEVAGLERRIREVNARLYGGTVSASRELTAMAADVEQMEARKSELEDRILEIMEEREPFDAAVTELESDRDRWQSQRQEAQSRLASAEEILDAETAGLEEERAAAAATVPADLLATYERLRARLDGVGAARLVGSTCSGCHLSLPATEIDRLKRVPADELVMCEQCGRILVRP